MKKALGLIETIGLVCAIEAADAAVKAANVTLLGYENTKGGGKITVKIAGSVGAVQAGVAAGAAAASRIGQVYGQIIIPRPDNEIDSLIDNVDRGSGLDEPKTAIEEPAEEESVVELAAEEETLEVIQDAEAVQCAAVTKSGDRCKLPAQPGSAYCFVHRKQTEE